MGPKGLQEQRQGGNAAERQCHGPRREALAGWAAACAMAHRDGACGLVLPAHAFSIGSRGEYLKPPEA